MKLYSWNVNGIRAVWSKGLLQKFIDEHDPDILCLQETKAMPHQSPIDLPQYEEFWNSAEKKGYSGTAIFSKTKPINVYYGFSTEIQEKYSFKDAFGDPSKEGRVLTAEFKNFFLVTVYTPNSKDKLERINLRHKVWDPAFLDHLKSLQKNTTQHFYVSEAEPRQEGKCGKDVVVCGDFNVAHMEIDLARPKENDGKHGFTKEERVGFDKMIDEGFVDIYRTLNPKKEHAYTWWTHWQNARSRNVGWRIDYWLCSNTLFSNIKDAKIHSDVMGSDHCPISIELKDEW